MNELDRRALLAGAGVLSAAALAAGGPLNPPAGPVASTAGPEPRIPINATNTPGTALAQFRISQPGSYYLPGNILAPAGAHGILIDADNVTLDLMGFTIQGSGGASGSGVIVNGALSNICIGNGAIRGFGDYGLQAFGSIRCSAINLRTSNNGESGIAVNQFGRVINCQSGNNTSFGISTNTGTMVSGCVVNNNGGNGFNSGPSCSFVQCTAYLNGADGFGLSSACLVTDCVSHANAFAGYSLGSACVARGCTAYVNGGTGFTTSSSGSLCEACASGDNSGAGFNGLLALRGCSAHSNDLEGINSAAYVDSCTASNNTGKGIETASGGLTVNSRSYQNGGIGFDIGNASVVTGSLAYDCGSVGITCAGNSFIAGNHVFSPASVGIVAAGGTTVRGNTVSQAATTAITASAASLVDGNFVVGGIDGISTGVLALGVRNAAASNSGTDYSFGTPGLCGTQVASPNVPAANPTANLVS